MNKTEQQEKVHNFTDVNRIECDNGYIVWRLGTGYNVELLHLKTIIQRQGTGKALVLAMLNKLKEDPPYATVFLFTRTNNTSSRVFYTTLGFEETVVKGVYDDGDAVLFSQRYITLLELHNL